MTMLGSLITMSVAIAAGVVIANGLLLQVRLPRGLPTFSLKTRVERFTNIQNEKDVSAIGNILFIFLTSKKSMLIQGKSVLKQVLVLNFL